MCHRVPEGIHHHGKGESGMTRSYITGTTAVAEAARLCEVEVVAAYPITPQTSIVEKLSQYVYDGTLRAELVPVESEHSAMSATVGAAMVGARAFTASSSQGLALMHEVLPYASGLRLPLVMAVANRSLASPVTIFADHQDSLPQRETGFLQFYLANCQEVFDSILLAYRVAEDKRVLLPVMACLDGFFLSHISEPVEIPDLELVRRFIPRKETGTPILDVDSPKSFNVMAFPEHFEEFQRDKYESMAAAAAVFDEAAAEFESLFGRRHHRVETYRAEDADCLLVGLGSMMGTAKECVDRLRGKGQKVGLARIKCYRPFPVRELLEVARPCRAIGVLDRDVAFGTGGILYQDVCRSLLNGRLDGFVANFIVGLGGRDVTLKTIAACYERMSQLSSNDPPAPGQDVFWPDESTELLKVWQLGSR